jgi:hypothetical protein
VYPRTRRQNESGLTILARSLRDGPDRAKQRHGNQYGSAHCFLLPREDVAEGATERIEPDNRKGQPKDCSPVLKIADDSFPRCVL